LGRHLPRRRQPRGRGPEHAGPGGRHLPVPAAGPQEPEGRAMSAFKARVRAVTTLLLVASFGFTKANPFANPYELHAMFRNAQNLKPRAPGRVAGVEGAQGTQG